VAGGQDLIFQVIAGLWGADPTTTTCILTHSGFEYEVSLSRFTADVWHVNLNRIWREADKPKGESLLN
jgi:hypothetical protein